MKNTVSAVGTLCLVAKRFAVGKCLKAFVLGAVVLGASPAFAGDPCKMVLCMFGKYSKVTGTGDDGGDECDSAEAEYFGILVYKKKKKIDWSATAKERLKQQNSCPTADRGKTKQINDKFGKARG
ncbi:conjugal transfer protein [Serratia proteamaculans]|uniref:conjugal transfer protein n=1 Tax=Serratia proteamaculans TaxID=28151 RepID=UPI003D03FD4A